MDSCIVLLERQVLNDTLTYRGEPLLTYRIEYPSFRCSQFPGGADMATGYYSVLAADFARHCRQELFPLAVEEYLQAKKGGYPVRAFEALMTYEIPLCQGCILSVFQDRYEYTGGAHGSTWRTSQTWNLQASRLMKLGEMIRSPGGVQSYVISQVTHQIAQAPGEFFPNYPALVAAHFCRQNFYCTPEAIVIYFQQYEIAPYARGIPEFSLPYGDLVINPSLCCFYT